MYQIHYTNTHLHTINFIAVGGKNCVTFWSIHRGGNWLHKIDAAVTHIFINNQSIVPHKWCDSERYVFVYPISSFVIVVGQCVKYVKRICAASAEANRSNFLATRAHSLEHPRNRVIHQRTLRFLLSKNRFATLNKYTCELNQSKRNSENVKVTIG